MKRTAFRVGLWVAVAAVVAPQGAEAGLFRYRFAKKPPPSYWREVEASGVTGSAVILCAVSRAGDLSNCSTVLEEPAGTGAGAALLASAPMYKMRGVDRRCAPFFNQVLLPNDFGVRTDKDPNWVFKPNGAQFFASYPAEALKQNLWGAAGIYCKLGADGVLSACRVLGENPEGHGFGKAALSLASKFKLSPAIKDKAPVAGNVLIPINFTARASWCSE